MEITIEDALDLPIMRNTKLIAGHHGILNPIRWVTIVEVLEDTARLQQGEFLITTGFGLLEDEKKLKKFHELLKSKLLPGIAIYTEFYMNKIPQSIIDIANEYNLPIIEIPSNINFSEITRAILEQITNKQLYLLSRASDMHRKLTELILNDQSLIKVTQMLADLTTSNIIIFNEFYDVIYENNEFFSHKKLSRNKTQFTYKNNKQIDISKQMILSVEKENSIHFISEDIQFTLFPIIAKQACFGWILMIKPKDMWKELDGVAIEQTTTIYALEFLKQQAIDETQLRIKSNFLEDVFSRNYTDKQIVIEQGLKLDYNFSLNQSVFYLTFKKNIDTDPIILDRLYTVVAQLLTQKRKQYLSQTKMKSIIFITNIMGVNSVEKYQQCILLAKAISKEWNYYFPNKPIIIGIGNTYNDLDYLKNSAQEAQYAAELNELIDTDDTINHYQDLGMYDLLINMKKSHIDLKTIYSDCIAPLINDNENKVDLIETLDVYFSNDQSIQDSAENLFIHRHTLRYRLNQIEERTGLNIKVSDNQLKLQLSVMAYKLDKLLIKQNKKEL